MRTKSLCLPNVIFFRTPTILGYVTAGWLLGSAAIDAVEAAETISSTATSFNIAAQPLMSALDAYSAAAGMQVVYDGALAAGRRSTAVRGTMAPELALQHLLQGTGLVVVYAAPRVFTLILRPVPNAEAIIEDYLPYLASVQNSIEEAFCSEPLTVPGPYRIKLSFLIDSAGKIVQSRLLGSTDNSLRDEAIASLLQGLTIDRPPPAAMPQPVVMEVSPRAPSLTGDCSAEDGPRRAAAP